jgi:DNA-binding MarR family transcriptional regulator
MITEFEPMTQAALGEALRIDRTTMVALIDELEARGYVQRKRHPDDRRAFLVHPTKAGLAATVAAFRFSTSSNAGFSPRPVASSGVRLAALGRSSGDDDCREWRAPGWRLDQASFVLSESLDGYEELWRERVERMNQLIRESPKEADR